MIFTLRNRICVSPNKRLLIAAPLIAIALAGILAFTSRIHSDAPQTAAQKSTEYTSAQLLAKIDGQCALALADHNSALSIGLERDPIRKEHQLKKIVLAKNRDWKAKATGISGTLEGLFKSTPFMVYKQSIDSHTRVLKRAKRKILRKCPEIAQPTVAKIEDTVAKLEIVNNYVTEHDHYLREHAASGGKGSMISMLFKFIPSPLKFLA